MHSKNVVHMDVKPDNILINFNDKKDVVNVYFTDFEFAEWIVDEKKMKKRCGSPSYIAPEMIMYNEYDGKKSEIWSSGIVLYVLLCGHFPFSHPDLEKLFDQIMYDSVPLPECYSLSDEVKDLIQRLLTKEPNERIAIEELFNHRWWTLYPTDLKEQIDITYKPSPSTSQENIKISQENIKKSQEKLTT